MLTQESAAHSLNDGGPRPTIVLVHGDWADGVVVELGDRPGSSSVASTWSPRPTRCEAPRPTAADLASYLKTIPGPIVLVGHSYGGFVITNAATGNPNVKALVYIDAFIPDQGEVLGALDAGSCLDPATAFNAVPLSSGETDLYLRIACRIRRTRASPSASPTASTASQTAQPGGRAAAGGRSPSWASRPGLRRGRRSRRGRSSGRMDRVIPPALQETDGESRRRPRVHASRPVT